MTENVKRVNNPLTIIAIFAALAEINATVSIGLIDKSLQTNFVWFIMIFPTVLIIAFFITLNFNAKALYSPSDYKKDDTFLNVLNVKKNREKLADIDNNIEDLIKRQLVSKEFISKLTNKNEEEIKSILKEFSNNLTNKIKTENFITLDFADFMENDNIFRYPAESFSNFQELLDEIYHKIKDKVGTGYTYGKTWVLKDIENDFAFRKQPTKINEKGAKLDLRELDDVGLLNGMNLRVVKL